MCFDWHFSYVQTLWTQPGHAERTDFLIWILCKASNDTPDVYFFFEDDFPLKRDCVTNVLSPNLAEPLELLLQPIWCRNRCWWGTSNMSKCFLFNWLEVQNDVQAKWKNRKKVACWRQCGCNDLLSFTRNRLFLQTDVRLDQWNHTRCLGSFVILVVKIRLHVAAQAKPLKFQSEEYGFNKKQTMCIQEARA